jgi:metaxin
MLESNQITLCPEPQRKEQKELLRMLDVLERIELYHSWCDQTTVKNVTKDRFTNSLDVQYIAKYMIFKSRQEQVISYLQIYNWHKLKPKEVISRLREILAVFSAQLENKKYLFGNRISEVDCLLFGHLYSILTTEYFSVLGPKLADIVHEFQNLVQFTSNIDNEIFKNYLKRESKST